MSWNKSKAKEKLNSKIDTHTHVEQTGILHCTISYLCHVFASVYWPGAYQCVSFWIVSIVSQSTILFGNMSERVLYENSTPEKLKYIYTRPKMSPLLRHKMKLVPFPRKTSNLLSPNKITIIFSHNYNRFN